PADGPLATRENGMSGRGAGPSSSAVDAAARVGAANGFAVDGARVLDETNNVVVWLYPHGVIAKVGRWPHSVEALGREQAVATALARAGAPIATPAAAAPMVDDVTGFVVTLWHRLEADPSRDVAPLEAGASLRELHEHLRGYSGELPDFRDHVASARSALDDDGAMAALPNPDRQVLRGAIDAWRGRVDAASFVSRPLHGEPHLGNVLPTPDGPRWVDLEDVCTGPSEWDLAFLPEDAVAAFGDVDADLLALLRDLVSAVVATWCWVRADADGMLPHARYHLARVKAARDV
ncbi:MAG TPA: hypothetical protein VEC15_09780, partial [Actinomycetota bacterium]|nr:hypothetical protein [Actinomycetota bacterium]